MQDKKITIVDKGSNHVIITTRSGRHYSAKERKEARKDAPRIVIYGMNEKEYERIASLYESIYKDNVSCPRNNIRARLIKESISEALRKTFSNGKKHFSIETIDKNK